MISRLTKFQLVIFAVVTVLGAAFVGGRYAQVDRLVVDRSFPVVAEFEQSGGIFAGAEVTYRGIAVGKVGKLEFTEEGLNVILEIEDSAPKIPKDTLVVVANKSAIGEQFVDLQPRASSGPFLEKGTVISTANTRIPIDTTKILIDLDNLVSSIDTESLKTLVDELGQAFEGTGRDLSRIVLSSAAFIDTADENFEVTRQLIRGSSTVLQTQVDKQSELATFSQNLALLSDTLVDADPDIRRLFDEGSSSAKLLDDVVNENFNDLTDIFRDLRIATKPIDRLHKGLEVVSILYPYLIEGGFSVIAESKQNAAGCRQPDPVNRKSDDQSELNLSIDRGDPGVRGVCAYDATFGLVITPTPPAPGGQGPVCQFENGGSEAEGYRLRREPNELGEIDFDVDSDCKDYSLVPRNPEKTIVNLDRAGAASVPGKDSWKWLLLDPATN